MERGQRVVQPGESTAHAVAPQGAGGEPHGAGKRLGAFLCWAVVFADIGTSTYYVPGILYGQVGHLAGFFVSLTLLVFLLLTLKYAEATVRFPEGGGEVTVASRGLSPWAGALGGTFILIDYFLTAAISSLSGLHYFSVVLPALTPYVVVITLVVIAGLGVLNWWGIQESATVSAVIASIAFLSDLVIIVVVLARVPLGDLLLILRDVFAGSQLTGVTVLTGYAGAFLAFSGLESIAQLAPVMRVPRRKTVTAALGLVVVTVAATGPLLTMFSTILLTDPRFRGTMASASYATNPEPSQFVSLLAGAYGGPVLAVATAVAASALLIFASNTAIIGAYHVVLALARMRYFPRVVTRTNALRGTPHVAIAVVTLIPLAVLILVQGNIDLLGQLYGFGLLGAFALMCISMDVIRWRERHGAPHIGARIDPELAGTNGYAPPVARAALNGHAHTIPPLVSIWERSARRVAGWRGQPYQPGQLDAPLAELEWRIRRIARTITRHLAAWWPNINYVLGFLTTGLLLVAWLTNLIGKPLATLFGGGLTALGLAVAVLHYRYQAARYPVVFLDLPVRIPGGQLVVLTTDKAKSKAVLEAALTQAKEHFTTFLYLAAPSHLPPPQLFEIRDRFADDEDAQRMLSRAKRMWTEAGFQPRYLYRAGGAKQVFDIAAKVRPDVIVAEAHTAKRITSTHALPSDEGLAISPDFVRYRPVGDTRVAFYVLHKLYQDEREGTRRTPPFRGPIS